ncbi:MAG: cytochrome c [Rhodospirillales bacterium]|nr:cytochrome c [Rhodospirillales bacterium]
MLRLLPLAAALLAALPARADELPVLLRPGPGDEVVQQNCAVCHSLDYIEMNSPFLSAAGWAAEVAKMRNLYGAPVSDADAAAIRGYLAATYAAPAP